jgi:AraC-like DNA-binding protein/mannose-6-phosphate isomerase-like protein (cupin superfamily)
MLRLRFPDEMAGRGPTDTGWCYWHPELDGIVEVGTLRGSDVGLPAHFHGENQITFVLSGRRRFLIRGRMITLMPGQGVLIPAGVAHRSFAEPSGVACLNIYVPAGEYDVAAMMRDAERQWSKAGRIRCTELATIVREHRRGGGGCIPANSTVPANPICPEPVSRAAERAGMSREGFSRMFARHHGMPPHAFWLMARLNHARELLRAGEGIAGVAVEAGFADQSHLGRWFRRAFGITPGRYRSGWPRSQTYQTRR